MCVNKNVIEISYLTDGLKFLCTRNIFGTKFQREGKKADDRLMPVKPVGEAAIEKLLIINKWVNNLELTEMQCVVPKYSI